jgi:hypothetical protein
MSYDVEILLKDTDRVVIERVEHDGRAPMDWTDEDVEGVLKGILLAIDRVKNPVVAHERTVSLRGLSWIVDAFGTGVVIAIEIPSGAAVAGPFAITPSRLTTMIARVLGQNRDRVH